MMNQHQNISFINIFLSLLVSGASFMIRKWISIWLCFMQIWGRCHFKSKLIIHEKSQKALNRLKQVVAHLNKPQLYDIVHEHRGMSAKIKQHTSAIKKQQKTNSLSINRYQAAGIFLNVKTLCKLKDISAICQNIHKFIQGFKMINFYRLFALKVILKLNFFFALLVHHHKQNHLGVCCEWFYKYQFWKFGNVCYTTEHHKLSCCKNISNGKK